MSLSTAEDVRIHARKMELAGVDYLGADGRYAKDDAHIVLVRFKFVDGQAFLLNREQADQLNDFEFNLRPSRDDG